MSCENIIRAWKEEEFRQSLGEKERVSLPEHPAGLIELSNADLSAAVGGQKPVSALCSYEPHIC